MVHPLEAGTSEASVTVADTSFGGRPAVDAALPRRERAVVVSRRAWIGLLLASSSSMVVGLAVTAMNIAFPAIERSFGGAARSTVSWGITGYAIGLASLLLVGGRLADRVGRRRIYRLGVAVFMVASIGVALSPTVWVFIAARLAQAAGAALASPASLALVLPLFPESRRITAVATWTSVGTLGSAIGPSLAAAITQQSSWRWIFVIPALACGVAFVLAPRVLPAGETVASAAGAGATAGGERGSSSRIDGLGALIGTVAIGAIAFTITEGPRLGWTSISVLIAAVSALVLGPLFVARSMTHATPLLNPRLFTVRTVWSANLANLFLSASGLSVWLIYPLFLVQHWHYSLLRAGLAITPSPVVAAGVGIMAGRLAERHGVRAVIGLGSIVPLLGTSWLVWRVGTHEAYWRDFLPGAVLYSIGFGLIFSPLTAAALRGVGTDDFGQANAAFNAVRQLAGGLGIAIVVALLGDAPLISLANFNHAYVAVAVMTLLGWIAIVVAYPRNGAR